MEKNMALSDMVWTTVPIATLYTGLYDGPHATPKPSIEGPIFLGIPNMREDGGLDLSDIRHIAEEDYPTWTRRVVPQEGDIVFSYEASLHRYAIIPRGFRGCLGRRMALVRPKHSKVNTRYLYYSPYAAKRTGWSSRSASKAICKARAYSLALSAKWVSWVSPFNSSSLI
jgi:hypothetical protein